MPELNNLLPFEHRQKSTVFFPRLLEWQTLRMSEWSNLRAMQGSSQQPAIIGGKKVLALVHRRKRGVFGTREAYTLFLGILTNLFSPGVTVISIQSKFVNDSFLQLSTRVLRNGKWFRPLGMHHTSLKKDQLLQEQGLTNTLTYWKKLSNFMDALNCDNSRLGRIVQKTCEINEPT